MIRGMRLRLCRLSPGDAMDPRHERSEPPTDYAAKDGNFRLRNGMICARILYSGMLVCMHFCLRGRLPFFYCKTAKTLVM
jgi:hypothetical protein